MASQASGSHASDGAAPLMPIRSRGRSLRRWGLVAVLSVLGVGLLAAVGVVAWLDRSVDRVEVDGLGPTPEPPAAVSDAAGDEDDEPARDDPEPADQPDVELEPQGEALTVLLLGSDTREVLTEEEQRELGTGYAWGERTEAVVLLRLDPDADEMRMLSIPRDTLLTRCDGSRGRINAAYAIGEREGVGGMTCVVETLTTWTDVTIDHAVKVDFRGFVDVVEALGGVPMVLDEPLRDRRANLDLEAGCTRLDGAQSLAFVRARSIDDDYGRMARQQRFVEELRRELASVGVFDDLPRLLRTADAIARSVELDSSLTLNRIQQLARQHRTTMSSPIDARSMPGEPDISDDGFYFLEVTSSDADEQVAWLERGTRDADDETDAVTDDAPDTATDDAPDAGAEDGADAEGEPDDATDAPSGTTGARTDEPSC